MAGHHQRGLKHRALGLDGQHRLAHDLRGCRVQRQLGQSDARKHIAASQDAAQSALFIGQQYRANFLGLHQAQNLAQRSRSGLTDRRAQRQLGQGAFQVTLLLQLGLQLLAPALAGIFQESEHTLVQKISPRRAHVHQGTGRSPGNEQAKAVVQRAVGAAHRPPCQQGGYRKKAAGLQLESLLHRAGPATQHAALAQKNQMLKRRGRRDDHRLGRKVALVRSKRKLLHMGAIHADKRQMSEQGRHPVLKQLMRRAHGPTIARPGQPGKLLRTGVGPRPGPPCRATQARVSL